MPDNTNFQEHLETVAQDFQERSSGVDLPPDQEKKIIKEIVKEKFSPSVPVSSPPAAQANDDAKSDSATQAQSREDLNRQYQAVVDGFIQNAISGDLTQVVKEVNRSNNPWVIDQFHDVLVDKFYSEIKARQQNSS